MDVAVEISLKLQTLNVSVIQCDRVGRKAVATCTGVGQRVLANKGSPSWQTILLVLYSVVEFCKKKVVGSGGNRFIFTDL